MLEQLSGTGVSIYRPKGGGIIKKKNCWELKKCGLEPGGKNTAEKGVCPAAADASCDGLNNGKNAGRICWFVKGTYCNGDVPCLKCEFIKKVKEEEGEDFNFLKPGVPWSHIL